MDTLELRGAVALERLLAQGEDAPAQARATRILFESGDRRLWKIARSHRSTLLAVRRLSRRPVRPATTTRRGPRRRHARGRGHSRGSPGREPSPPHDLASVGTRA